MGPIGVVQIGDFVVVEVGLLGGILVLKAEKIGFDEILLIHEFDYILKGIGIGEPHDSFDVLQIDSDHFICEH